MNFVSDYARSITGFIILSTFIGIIMPSDKMKKYINLILGLVLMLIIISPISNLLKNSNKFISMEMFDFNKNYSKNGKDFNQSEYEKKYNEMLKSAFNTQFIAQANSIANKYNFEIVSADVKTSEDLKNISSINLEIKEYDKKDNKQKLIRIEPIDISKDINKSSIHYGALNQNKENENMKNFKNEISSFYNLSYSNININVDK